ncbi:hypothetical protein ID866_12902, partial [Astraeus odoratus]
VGPTGAGKSSFIGRAVGSPYPGVGHELTSFTTQVRAVRYPHSDGIRNIVLADTPGFDDTHLTDTSVLQMITDWLEEIYKQNAKLSGILYFHRIADPRAAGTPLRNLNMFRELCGKDDFQNVILVTTMWDELQTDIDLGIQREKELLSNFWQPMVVLGSTTRRFDGTEECAWNIINSIPTEHQPLQIQGEIVEEGKPTGLIVEPKVNLLSMMPLHLLLPGMHLEWVGCQVARLSVIPARLFTLIALCECEQHIVFHECECCSPVRDSTRSRMTFVICIRSR